MAALAVGLGCVDPAHGEYSGSVGTRWHAAMLIGLCRAPGVTEEIADKNRWICDAYLLGSFDMLASAGTICPPDGVTAERIRFLWLAKASELSAEELENRSASALAVKALAPVFPCGPKP